jgi:serine/threonine-protein kinase
MVAISTAGITVPVDPTEPYEEREERASGPLDTGPRYEVGAPIGHGGMGEVISAHDMQIGREVAIKRLYGEPTETSRSRFLREARIQGRLEHPSIPPVYELSHGPDGEPYFAMRKLAGVTLAATLRDRSSPFSVQRLLRAFIDICNAVDLAHSRRIIHRDIKPANILLGERGEVYVLDWGIARELDAPDPTAGPRLGTPGYMAPEQICGLDDLDERVDVYALGCLLFEILTRTQLHPRNEANLSALRGDFPAVPDMPPELAEACRRATHLDRARRTSSVRELIASVQGFLDGDRDLEQRRNLARQHLARATAALCQHGDETQSRAVAMREAGQALALDPTLTGAAEVIGRIMLEPPAKMPAEVEREIRELDWRASRTMAHLSVFCAAIFVALLPVLLLLGMRDVPYMAAYGGLSVALLGCGLLQLRVTSAPLMTAFLVGMIAMFALIARMFSPLLIAPALASTFLATTPFSPLVRRSRALIWVTAGALLAIFGVLGAELVGWLSPTTTWADGRLVLTSPLGLEDFPALEMIALTMTLMITIGSASSYVAMRQIKRAREQVLLQGWHLRQLAPTVSGGRDRAAAASAEH